MPMDHHDTYLETYETKIHLNCFFVYIKRQNYGCREMAWQVFFALLELIFVWLNNTILIKSPPAIGV